MRARSQLLIAMLAALAIRLPFVNQAFQLDDVYYLAGARHVQDDPAHPSRASYIFLGERHDMRGHPHPPLDVWTLGLLLRTFGEIREVPFHAAYAVFSLVIGAASLALARRFTSRPLLATLLVLAVPPFVVHGNGIESDILFTALWLSAAAAFFHAVDLVSPRWLAASAVLLVLASLAAYQVVLLAPVLALYAWRRKRGWWPALAVCAIPFAVTAGYQLYERLTSGALPASVLMGHFRNYQLQSPQNKLRNALALTSHLAWLVFPVVTAVAFARRNAWILAGAAAVAGAFYDPHPLFWASFALGVLVLAFCIRDHGFLSAWVLIFFGGALIVFFAGSARYLLPVAPAVVFLAVRQLDGRPNWLRAGLGLQLAFSLALAWSHYQYAGAYRDFVRALDLRGKPAYINGEWGLQYYGAEAGAQPLLRHQEIPPGAWILSSRLGYPVPFATPGGELRTVAERAVVPSLPLRVIALNARSAFSTISFGVRPFDITRAPADILRAEVVDERLPALSFLPMSAPEAERQIVAGIYGLEGDRWRWTSGQAVVLLKRPARPSPLVVNFVVPDQSPARRIVVTVDGAAVLEHAVRSKGPHTLATTSAVSVRGNAARVAFTIDATFSPPGEQRRLGVILLDIGFRMEAGP